MPIFILTLIGIIPAPDVNYSAVHCDVIELNANYHMNGVHQFDQMIFWNSSAIGDIVIDFYSTPHRPIKFSNKEKAEFLNTFKVPLNDPMIRPFFGPVYIKDGLYISLVHKNGKYYRVYAKSYIETHTQYDREIENRDIFPQELRRFPLFK